MKSCKQVSFDHLGSAGNSDIFDVIMQKYRGLYVKTGCHLIIGAQWQSNTG